MKKKSWKQALSMLLAVALMATLLVVPASAAPADGKYIFAPTDLATGKKAIGTNVTTGTEDYFTIRYGDGGNDQVTGNTTKFSDNFTATQAFRPNGASTGKVGRVITFTPTTDNPTVTIWWTDVSGNINAGRAPAIWTSAGTSSDADTTRVRAKGDPLWTGTLQTDASTVGNYIYTVTPQDAQLKAGTEYAIGCVGKKIDICRIEVEEAAADPTITPAPKFTEKVVKLADSKATFTLTAAPDAETVYNLYASDASSDTTVVATATTATATVEFAGVDAGTYYVAAKKGELTESSRVALTIRAADSVDTVTLSKNSVTLDVGGTETLTATTEPAETTETITWTSNNEAAATVSGGVVTAVKPGVATITATANDYADATATVVVNGTTQVTGPIYTFNADQMAPAAGSATVKYDSYYTLLVSAETYLAEGAREWTGSDALTTANYLRVTKKPTATSGLKFATSNPATVKIWWVAGGANNRQIAIYNTASMSAAAATTSQASVAQNGAYVSTLELPDAGTYVIGANQDSSGTSYIGQVIVTETREVKASDAEIKVMEDATLFQVAFPWDGRPSALSDMQTGVTIAADENNATKFNATGTLKYVTGFTGFSGRTEEQQGNYLAWYMPVPAEAVGKCTIVAKLGEGGTADKNLNTSAEVLDDFQGGKVLAMITRVGGAKNPTYVVDWDGEGDKYTPETYTLDVSGLKLEKPASVTPAFTSEGDVSQLTSKTDKEVSFTLSNASAGDYVLYDAEGNKACSADSVKADNGVITFTLSTALDPATADSTDDVTYTVKVTDDADHGQSAAAEVTVKRYIPVVSVGLTHFTESTGGDVAGTVTHVLYEKLNSGDADVIGGPDNQNPDHPNGWKLVPTVKGPGTKTPTDPRVVISNARGQDEVCIHVDSATQTVTAIKAGTGRVRVTSVADSEIYSAYDVTVKVRIGEITLKKGEDTVGTTLTAAMGDELTLKAEVAASTSASQSHQTVNWDSSDKTVATVSETGVVTLLKPGTTNITATSTHDETATKSVELTVEAGAFTPTLTVGNPDGYTGTSKARLKLAGVPDGAGAVTFTVTKDGVESSDFTVTALEDDADGYNYQVAALPAGTDTDVTYTITANVAASDKWNAATATATIKVLAAGTKNINITSPGATSTVNAVTGQSEAVNLAVTAEVRVDGVKDEEATAALTYAWSKGGTAIDDATSASYAIPAADLATAGTLTYVCTVSHTDAEDKTVTFTVNVTDPAMETITVTPGAGVTYDATTKTVTITGDVVTTFTVTTGPDGHKDTLQAPVSSKPSVARVAMENNTLTITPWAAGDTDVTLRGTTATDVTEVIHVHVVKAAAPAALTENDYTVTQPTTEGGKGTITITQTPANPNGYFYKPAEGGDWTLFPEGNSVELEPGTYKIRVRVPKPELQETTDGVPVTINAYQAPVTVTAVAITTEANSVAVDGTLQLTASITTSDNKTNAATADDVEWSVENGTGSATISEGVLTGVAEGTVTVKATSKKNDTKFDTKVITVTPKTVSKFNVTVTGGTFTVNGEAALTAAAGDTVKATASVPAGKVFDKWTATGITLDADQAASNPLTFTMPANVVALEASFKDQTTTPVDKTALTAAITAAEAVDVTGVKVSEDGADVPTTEKWIAKSVKDAFDDALADAKAVADDADQATVDAAKDALTAATTALTEAIENAQKGTKPVDKADLTAAIEAAEAKMEGVLTSTNGKDVDPDKTWVTAAVKKALEDAIAKAEEVIAKADPEATVEEITEAAEALAAASEAFVPAAGTKTGTTNRPSHGGGTVSTPVSDKKTETLPDGTKRETETAKDGTVTVTDTLSDGTKTVTVTTPEGESTTTVTLGRGTESVQVSIPVEDATSGMVAVIVKPDGTEEIIRDSVVVNGEVVFDLDKDATVKVVDKTKSFVDVPGHWAESDVNFVAARDLFNGVSSTHFAPDATMTRGMMATVLYRLDGETKADKSVDFSDVTVEDWFAEAVDWAAEEGVITGYTDGSFGPDRSITREELVVMIYRYAGAPEVDAAMGMAGFHDVDQVSTWAEAAMRWAVQNGIIQGKGNGTLDPQGNASRAEVSAVLQRYVKLAAK